MHAQMQITDPTNLSLDPKNLVELSLPLGAEGIVAQDQPGDAGEEYSAASAAYQDDPDACDEYAQKPEGPPPGAMQLVIDATHLSQMNLFGKDPGKVIDYQSDHLELDGLGKIGQEMESAALSPAAGRENGGGPEISARGLCPGGGPAAGARRS